MVNYVNTVLVGKNGGAALATTFDPKAAGNAFKSDVFVIINAATGAIVNASTITTADAIKIGYITNKMVEGFDGEEHPVIRWSNVIKRNNLKSYVATVLTNESDGQSTEDTVTIDLHSATIADLKGKRLVVRVAYKDMPTRYRKWTDSFEYVVKNSDTLGSIATALTDAINGKKRVKRGRVHATATTTSGSEKIVIEAKGYHDDDTKDTINVANKMRFNVNMYLTDPSATGFDFSNKYAIAGVAITKVPGKTYKANWKLVRDQEAQAMGYAGILNRGEGTWPIIKPDMNVKENTVYNFVTLEFETMYRAADDILRYTKECVEIYDPFNEEGTEDANIMPVKTALDAWLGANAITGSHATENLDD